MGEGADRAGRSRGRTGPPRGTATENPDRGTTIPDPRVGQRPRRVWSAPTTTDRDRKELLGTLLTEVTISLDRAAGHADLVLRWKGGALTDLRVPLTTRTSARLRTDEDTIDLVRRLAVHYPDAQIAGILNRQNRSTATGLPFTAGRVQALRHHWNIPCHQPDVHTSRPVINH